MLNVALLAAAFFLAHPIFADAVAWAQGLWLGRGGVWNERVEVAVSNSTDKAWCAESVRVDVPALANARPESIRLVDSCGTQLEYAVVSPGRFILPVSAAPGEVSRYWLYAGNPHAWGLSDQWPHKPKRKIAAADVRVGDLERRNLGADGENAPWPESGGWEYRVPVRVCNSGDVPIEQALVPVPSVEVFHATRNPIGCVMFNGERVPSSRVGNIYTFAADVPARHVRTYYLYVKSAGGSTAPVPVQTGETLQASEIPSDQAYRERQKADGEAAKLFANLLHSKINLVRNGDFAKGEEGWTPNGQNAGVTRDIVEGGLFGDRCARISAEKPDAKKWKGRVQRIPVKPGRKYMFGAFVKGINATERSNVHLHLVDSKGVHRFGIPYGKIAGPPAQHEKTFDWTPHFGSVEIRDPDVVAIELHLTMNGGGTLLQDGAFVAESAVGAEVLTGEVEPRPLLADVFAVAQVSSTVKVFPEHHVVDSAGPFSTALARNETEDIQLAVRVGRPCSVRLEVTPPRNAQGEALAVEVGVVGYVPVDFPSAYYSVRTPEEVLRMPNHGAGCDGWSGLWPDPVERGDSFEMADNAARSVRLAVTAGASARPGTYAGEIVWRQDGTIRRRDRYEVKVWNFDLPARPMFAATYDLRFGRDKSCWRVPGEKTQEGAERRVLDFMAKYKICPDDIKKNLGFTRDAAGNVTVDFAEYDQAAERFFGHYGFPNAYSPGCFYIFGWGHPPKKFLGEEPYEGKYPYKDADRKVLRPAYKKAYQDALRLYWNHLKEKGWDKRIVLYICDEPYFLQMKEIRDQMIALCDMIHEVDAAIPVYVSTWRHCAEWEECLDVWGVGAYGCFPMDVMARMHKAGRRFWFTCDGQQCLDTPYCAIERLQPVYCWAYGVEKYEFWGCNWTTYDPWKYGWHSFIRQSGTPGDTFWTRYPNGDGYHIYPPRKGAEDGTLSASLRLCAIRDGVEEHTYLEKLSVLAADKTAGASARKAAALCDEYRALVPVPNAGGRYSSKILPEPAILDRLRNRAGELLSTSGKGED